MHTYKLTHAWRWVTQERQNVGILMQANVILSMYRKIQKENNSLTEWATALKEIPYSRSLNNAQ